MKLLHTSLLDVDKSKFFFETTHNLMFIPKDLTVILLLRYLFKAVLIFTTILVKIQLIKKKLQSKDLS